MFGASTSVGAPMRAMTLAIVKVLPEPVTPSSVWQTSPSLSPANEPFDRLRLVACRGERLRETKRRLRVDWDHGNIALQ